MTKLLKTKIGRLRIVALLEGISLLVLVFIAMPLKYLFSYPDASQSVGAIHGGLFVLFVFNTLSVGIEQRWEFNKTTWKVLIACIVPFGTFYIDKKILSRIENKEEQQH